MHVFLLMPPVGSVSVKLSKGCWGTVEVCREEQVGERECGEICSYTWRTDVDSNMICGNLGCGTPIPGQLTHQINSPNVSYYSVYCSKNVKNMSMCNFIPKKNFTCNFPAQVICTGNVKSCFIHGQKFMLTHALFIRILDLSHIKLLRFKMCCFYFLFFSCFTHTLAWICN